MSESKQKLQTNIELWEKPIYHVDIPNTALCRKRAKQLAEEMGDLNGSIENGEGNFAGLLAELVFCDIFDATRSATYERDIVKDGLSVDVKTKRRGVEPQPEFEASVADFNTEQDADVYYFTSYNVETGVCSFLGYIGTDEYYRLSDFRKEGEIDESNQFRFKADCHNLKYSKLKQCELSGDTA